MVILMLKQSQSGTSKIEATFLLLLILILSFYYYYWHTLMPPHSRSLVSGATQPVSVVSLQPQAPVLWFMDLSLRKMIKGQIFNIYVFALCKCDPAIANSFVLVVFIPHQ